MQIWAVTQRADLSTGVGGSVKTNTKRVVKTVGDRPWLASDCFSYQPQRSVNGHITNQDLPMTFSRGTSPQWRPSLELMVLSPKPRK